MAVPNVPLVIHGKDIHRDAVFSVISPKTNQSVYTCTNATTSDAVSAVESASSAFDTWSRTTPGHRRDIFLKAASLVESRAEELAQYMIDETGSDKGWADFNVNNAKNCLLSCAGQVATIVGSIPSLEDPTTGGMVVKEPYGVVFALAPWNAPCALGFRAVAWPLVAGNTVVFKGSELSPKSLWAVCSIFKQAGLPDGVLNFLACDPATAPAVTSAIIDHLKVKKINFTGSTNVGRIIAKMAGQNLKPVLLELGGKAPAIVCEDADLSAAAQHCVIGSFLHAGQICMSTERILVHESIVDKFQKELARCMEAMYSGEHGVLTLIQAAAVAKNTALIQEALDKGAKEIYGSFQGSDSSETRLRPIIVGNVKPAMKMYYQESFGPTASLIPFKSDEEALRIANDTEYGLSSAVFSTDLRRALRIARQIETGAVHINRMTVHDEPALPHGGAKASGFGRFNGALDEWVRTKNITYDL